MELGYIQSFHISLKCKENNLLFHYLYNSLINNQLDAEMKTYLSYISPDSKQQWCKQLSRIMYDRVCLLEKIYLTRTNRFWNFIVSEHSMILSNIVETFIQELKDKLPKKLSNMNPVHLELYDIGVIFIPTYARDDPNLYNYIKTRFEEERRDDNVCVDYIYPNGNVQLTEWDHMKIFDDYIFEKNEDLQCYIHRDFQSNSDFGYIDIYIQFY